MEKYEHNCGKCKKTTYTINDYFCIKNTGRCEWCLGFEKNPYKNKRAKYGENSKKKFIDGDLWAKYRPKNLSTVKE